MVEDKNSTRASHLAAALIVLLVFLAIGTPALMTFNSALSVEPKPEIHVMAQPKPDITDQEVEEILGEVMNADLR